MFNQIKRKILFAALSGLFAAWFFPLLFTERNGEPIGTAKWVIGGGVAILAFIVYEGEW